MFEGFEVFEVIEGFEVFKKPSAPADGLGVPNVDLWIVTLSLSRRRTSQTHPCRRLT